MLSIFQHFHAMPLRSPLISLRSKWRLTGFSRRFTPKNPVRLHKPFGQLPRWGAKNVLPLNLIAFPRGEGCDTRIPSSKKRRRSRHLNPEPNESKVKRGCEEMGIHFFTAPFLLPGMGKGERISAAGVSDSSCHAVHPLSISDISSRASMLEPATAGAGRNGKPAWGAGARRPS